MPHLPFHIAPFNFHLPHGILLSKFFFEFHFFILHSSFHLPTTTTIFNLPPSYYTFHLPYSTIHFPHSTIQLPVSIFYIANYLPIFSSNLISSFFIPSSALYNYLPSSTILLHLPLFTLHITASTILFPQSTIHLLASIFHISHNLPIFSSKFTSSFDIPPSAPHNHLPFLTILLHFPHSTIHFSQSTFQLPASTFHIAHYLPIFSSNFTSSFLIPPSASTTLFHHPNPHSTIHFSQSTFQLPPSTLHITFHFFLKISVLLSSFHLPPSTIIFYHPTPPSIFHNPHSTIHLSPSTFHLKLCIDLIFF